MIDFDETRDSVCLSSAIFIFTRDRPIRFCETLKNIACAGLQIFVLDDSVVYTNRLLNRSIAADKEAIYIGAEEFELFVRNHQIHIDRFNLVLRSPGNTQWNLGYMRNLALLIARSEKILKALFVDDDITVNDVNIISRLLNLTEEYSFTGAFIGGMVDDSILGHVATGLGMPNERMLSGGFLAFNVSEVDHYFLNNYNEDWIWLFLQLNPKTYLQTGEVFQSLNDPFDNYECKIIFQEFGECVLEGLFKMPPSQKKESLISYNFWVEALRDRNDHLSQLLNKAEASRNKKFVDIINYAKTHSKDWTASVFQELFIQYFLSLKEFHQLFKSLG